MAQNQVYMVWLGIRSGSVGALISISVWTAPNVSPQKHTLFLYHYEKDLRLKFTLSPNQTLEKQ